MELLNSNKYIMKYIYLIILKLTTSFLFSFNNTNLKSKSPKTFPFELSINNIDGTLINLENFKGKNILFVNVG